MGSTFFETFAEFKIDAHEADRTASAASISMYGTVIKCRRLISDSRELVAKVNEILERDHKVWRRGRGPVLNAERL